MFKHYFEINFVTLGQLSIEIGVIFYASPFDFSAIFSLICNDFSSKFINI